MPELQKGFWPRTQGNDMCRSVQSVDRGGGDPSVLSSLYILNLIRRTGDGRHLFRRVLALRQHAALRRVELEPGVVSVCHHRAKAKELRQIHSC